MPKVVVFIADGTEEIEAVITIDVLRRGGVDVTVAGIDGDQPAKCSRDVVIKPDTSMMAIADEEFDVLILPGGLGGAKKFSASAKLGEMLRKQEERGAYIAAICAAPTALASHKIASGKTLTSYPSFGAQLAAAGYKYSQDRVVVDGRLITSRGPGTAFEFGLKLVEVLVDTDTSNKIAEGMLVAA